jgi:hypothetical protein
MQIEGRKQCKDFRVVGNALKRDFKVVGIDGQQ